MHGGISDQVRKELRVLMAPLLCHLATLLLLPSLPVLRLLLQLWRRPLVAVLLCSSLRHMKEGRND